MATVQSFLTYSTTNPTNYVNWGQGIGNALSALGWVKQSDAATVNWANITTETNVPQYFTPIGNATGNVYAGAWTAGTNYTVTTNINVTTTQSTFATVTDVGLTYACVLTTATIFGANCQALQNSAQTLTLSAVASSGGTQNAVYTTTGTGVVGQQYVVTGFPSANNNGTFMCQSVSAGASITLDNSGATAQTNAATATSSTSTISFINLQNGSGSTGFVGFIPSNSLVGHTLVVSGFTGGATGNNASYVVTSNGVIQDNSNNYAFAATATGTNATQTGITIAEGTHPASDPNHWVPYNYEIWRTNGPNTSVAPIYLKLVYAVASTNGFGGATNNSPAIIVDVGTQIAGVGALGGNHTTEFVLGIANNTTGIGAAYECDFCAPTGADELAFVLWRNGTQVSGAIPVVLFIDRAKDQNGNALSTFFTVGFVSNNTNQNEYVIFNSAVGGVITLSAGGGVNNRGWTIPIVPLGGASSGAAYQGLTPVLPIFPIPGYVANPCLMAVAMKNADFTDGQLVNAVLYGTSHTFLMSKGTIVDQPQLGSAYPGIRWE